VQKIDDKAIANALRTHRQARGLSQKQVAALLGLKDNTLISRWELGVALPSLQNAFRLSSLFQTTVEVLFGEMSKNQTESAGKEEGCHSDSCTVTGAANHPKIINNRFHTS